MNSQWRRSLNVIATSLVAIGLAACGSSAGTSSTSSSSVSTIADLPLASGRVVSSSSSSVSSKALTGLTKALASTGVALKTMNSSSFNSASSLAMCEYANMLKSAVNEAAQGDTILCYVKQMNSQFSALSGVNIYDGNRNKFILDFGNGDNNFRVQLQIAKNTSGAITDFKMWACEGTTQSEYLHQSNAGSDFTMTSKHIDGSGVDTFSGSTTVTGTLNSSNQFIGFKTIDSSNSYGQTYSGGHGSRTVVQGVDSATISAWDKGTWSWQGGSGGYQRSFCSNAELLNTGLLATLAVGSGAAQGVVSGSYDGGTYTDTFEQGWNGDTTAAGSNAFLTSLNCTPPTVGDAPTIAFTGDEVFDCSSTGATSMAVDETGIEAACSDLQLGWEWINCWDDIESE